MRLFRELFTIAVGQSASNGISLENEQFVGIHVLEDSDAADLKFQALVAGNLGDVASEVWRDILLTTTDFPPYTSVLFSVVTASIVDGAVILFPHDKAAFLPPVIRVVNIVAGVPTNITGTPFTARAITDPHL